MKDFLKKTSLFALLALLSAIALELLLLTVSNGYSYKRKYVEEHGDRIKVLILGHSHASNGLIPEQLGDSVFNMAISGRAHHYDAVLAERYLPELKNLRCVIWPLGYNFQYASYRYPCTFRKEKEISYTSTYQCMYEKYMDISYERYIPYLHWSEILSSKLGYGARIFRRDFEEKNLCIPSGYEPSKLSDKTVQWRTEKLPIEVDYDNPHAPLARQEGLDDFKRIARACREAGVRLVVVTFPCYRSFWAETTERGMTEMRQCVDTMRSVCPELTYCNYMKDPRFEEDDFFNSSHLTEVGAAKFSRILREEALAGDVSVASHSITKD